MPIVTINLFDPQKKYLNICLIAEKTKENRVIQPVKLIAINMH